MTVRTYFRLAALNMLAFALSSPLHGFFLPEQEKAVDLGREMENRAAARYFPAPPDREEWVWLQDGPARDGGRIGPGSGGPRRGPQGGPGGRGRFDGPMGGARPPFPPRILNQLRSLKPDERERVLQNNPRFRELSPERKAELLNRLNMLLEMNDEQRRDLDRRLSAFRSLTPEQRRKAREIYEHHWRTLAAERRMAIMEEFRNLRDMSEEDRGKRVVSDEYQTQFSSEERALLSELSSL